MSNTKKSRKAAMNTAPQAPIELIALRNKEFPEFDPMSIGYTKEEALKKLDQIIEDNSGAYLSNMFIAEYYTQVAKDKKLHGKDLGQLEVDRILANREEWLNKAEANKGFVEYAKAKKEQILKKG